MASPNDMNGAQPGDQSGLPEWARIQADLPNADETFDIEEQPQAPNVEQAVKPAAPARPRRTQPPAPEVPAAPVPVPAPAQPVPVPAAPATPVVEPAPVKFDTPVVEKPAPVKQPAPKPAAEPLPEEDFTMEVVKPRAKPKTLPGPISNENWAPQAAVPQWEQEAETAAGKSKKTSRKTKAKRANAGGRWKVLAVRYSIYGAVGLVMVLGVLRIVNPNPISISSVTQSVLTELGRNGFPLETGQQLGARFTREYLTYNAVTKNSRDESLKSYFPGGKGPDTITWAMSNDPSWRQSVVDGPYVVGIPDVVDDTHITLTYAALISTPLTGTKDGSGNIIAPTWVYLSVPLTADENGHVAVSGPPAFVPAPAIADKVDYLNEDVDTDASATATPRVKEFFQQWAAASAKNPVTSQYLTPDATDAARNGLNGLVTLPANASDPIVNVTATTDKNATERTASVVVTWTTSAGMKMTQAYRMTLVNDGERWYVKDLHGTTFQTVG